MPEHIYTSAQLYKITYTPTEQVYYGTCYAKDKTYLDRFQEHMSGKGGVYIKKLIDDGALKEEFKTELLGIYPLEECKQRETDLANTSLYPIGLNGNAGSMIVQTKEVRQKISDTKTGVPLSEKTKKKMSDSHKGIPMSEEQKKIRSEGRKGFRHSAKTKKKMSETRAGVPKSEEHKRKIYEARWLRSVQ